MRLEGCQSINILKRVLLKTLSLCYLMFLGLNIPQKGTKQKYQGNTQKSTTCSVQEQLPMIQGTTVTTQIFIGLLEKLESAVHGFIQRPKVLWLQKQRNLSFKCKVLLTADAS